MRLIAETAPWLAVVLAAWVPTTALAGARRDERLARSGGRALHAVAVLMLIALGSRLGGSIAAVSEAPRGVATSLAVRELWVDPAARLAMWAAAIACCAAAVTAVVRRDPRALRVRAHVRAGVTVFVFTLAAAGTAMLPPAGAGEGGEGAPIVVHVAAGVVGRLLLAIGIAALVVPLAVAHAPRHRESVARWTWAALATIAAALALLAHTHYALLTAPAVLDESGAPASPPWTALSGLWALPILLVAALAYRLGDGAGSPRPAVHVRAAAMLLLALAAIAALAVVAPAVIAWTEAREAAPSLELRPPLLVLVAVPAFAAGIVVAAASSRRDRARLLRDLIAGGGGGALLTLAAATAGVRDVGTLVGIAAAGALAGLLGSRAVGAAGLRVRSLWIAQSAAVVVAGAALAALSVRPAHVEVAPGAPASVSLAGREWRIASQGVSQDETAGWDGIVIAFDVRSDGRGRIVAPGERAYRDDHGHAATRAAVPAIVRGAAGDLRLVVRGTRGDTARLHVRYHPLVTLAWIAAAGVVVALVVAALAPRARIPSPEEDVAS